MSDFVVSFGIESPTSLHVLNSPAKHISQNSCMCKVVVASLQCIFYKDVPKLRLDKLYSISVYILKICIRRAYCEAVNRLVFAV